VLAVMTAGAFVRKAYTHRLRINELQKQGIRSARTTCGMLCHVSNEFLFSFLGTIRILQQSSTSIICYHNIPEAVRRMRQGANQVFGTDTEKAAEVLLRRSAFLNQFRSTMAVSKKVFRLYPTAATMRGDRTGVLIPAGYGDQYPMDCVGVTVLHLTI
jgi:hypothetical protein